MEWKEMIGSWAEDSSSDVIGWKLSKYVQN